LVLSKRGCHIQEQSISAANLAKLASKTTAKAKTEENI